MLINKTSSASEGLRPQTLFWGFAAEPYWGLPSPTPLYWIPRLQTSLHPWTRVKHRWLW